MKREKSLMETYGANAKKSEKKRVKCLKKRWWYYGRKSGDS